jgi:penicillin-binding protein 1C
MSSEILDGAPKPIRTARTTTAPTLLIGLLAVGLILAALDFAFPPDLSRGARSSPVTLDRRGAWLRALPVENGRWRIRADLDRTDPLFVSRLIRIEDSRFDVHRGVDPFAVTRAAASALLRGRIRSGASTLTMQTARLLTPHRRTLAAKVIEMVRAMQLEERLSKRQILGLYLTLAPYGGNLEGVRAASLAYFGHEPASLTNGEQALLIALPQSPEARRPDRHPAAARAARAAVLAKMVRLHLIDPRAQAEANAEPLPHRVAFPVLAWHAAGELARAAPAGQASVVSTLDGDLQRRLEGLAARTARAQGPGTQVAILAIEIRSRAVRAAVGSAGLDLPGGWIDMTRALRSPGSALKPLIYGLAFDDGLATPDTQIDDTPRRFADYQPEDFDRVFHGPVTVREALIYSLNVPAVTLLDRIGAPAFETRIEATGARMVRPKAPFRDAGLALALGGEGITLRDLGLLYAALGDDGLARPLAWTEADADRPGRPSGVRLMRPAAARQVLDILREGPAPKGRAPSALTRGGPMMAFKTGTSYGFRDAVAAGVGGGYAMVVWTGRADGGARGGLTGRDAALPLLFDVADELGGPSANPPRIAPTTAPRALGRLLRPSEGPRLIFPPDGARIIVPAFGPSSRGLTMAAAGEHLSWYADGAPIPVDPVSGRAIWRPATAGFYRITLADAEGHRTEARVRVTAQ